MASNTGFDTDFAFECTSDGGRFDWYGGGSGVFGKRECHLGYRVGGGKRIGRGTKGAEGESPIVNMVAGFSIELVMEEME